ncbi:putative AMP-binding enzyme [Massarina eburnea CBS 473.64]|uniref:Putative AMP-binding enzyme n=1 Tax=Massarina eburnea CBS 473.64 TaxID=1395130 RepID=A0A6A6S5V2_9PLEO|nr:putative AMP-binding enzyme [Massarina eburnea CBS 473.64]
MPFFAKEHISIPTKDILTWQCEGPTYDENKLIYIDAADPSKSISAKEARVLIRKLIAGFRTAGVKKGDAVLIQSFNNIYYPILVLGIIGAGGIYTGTNPSYTTTELDNAIKLSKANFIITEPECLPTIKTAAQNLNIASDNILILDTQSNQQIPPGFKSWRTLLDHGEQDWHRFDDLATAQNTTAMLWFSSGTTGLPKAAQVSHYNLVAEHHIAFESRPRPYDMSRLVFLPMFHASTAPNTHVSPLRAGTTQVIMKRFDLATFFTHVEKFAVTDLILVPPIVATIVSTTLFSAAEKRTKFRNLKWVIAGAAPLDAVMQARLQTLLPCPFTQAWAMTETTCLATGFDYPSTDDTASVGHFLPNLDVKIVDDEGVDITAFGVTGELAIRGPTVVRGYVDVPRLRDFDSEGYFRTGDVVYADEVSGKWYIVDRKKDLIKVRGFQVAPAELEGVLLEHPDILDAAVVGVPDREAGSELPRAYVVRMNGAAGLGEREVEVWVETRLARYKRLVGGVRFVPVGGIPKSPSGKILKRVLRELAKREVGSKL